MVRTSVPQRPLSLRTTRRAGNALAVAACLGLAIGIVAASGPGIARAAQPIALPRQQVAPTLDWHTFLGGAGDDESYVYRGVAVDAGGNVYVTGSSDASWGSPIREHAGGWDAFVAALRPSGELRWTTFLGSEADDRGFGVALDTGGNVYVVGDSDDTWGDPLREHGEQWDVAVTCLTADGELRWNTFLGGTGDDYGDGIAVDDSGNVYVAGDGDTAWGTPVRPHGPGWDAFTARLAADGALRWHTFLGGTSPNAAVSARGVAVDAGGIAYVVGASSAPWGRPLRGFSPGPEDAYVAAVGTAGELLWNTFLGSPGEDYGDGVAVGSDGTIYVAGDSDGTWAAPVQPHDGGWDTFAAALAPTGAILWNTFVGGPGDDDGDGVAVDAAGTAFVVGDTSFSFGQPGRPHAGAADVYLAALSPGGALAWNLFLGGANDDEGRGVTTDAGGGVSVVGLSSGPWGAPVRPHGGGLDQFVAHLAYPAPTATPTDLPKATATATPTNVPTATLEPTATTTKAATRHRLHLPLAWQPRS